MREKQPVLLITFNRPDRVREVLEAVRKYRPVRLYVAQDGARVNRADDVQKTAEVRDVISQMVDWPCELHTLYQDANLGCGKGPAEAISWFFDHEEMGIVLEDDCVPHPDFFLYCEELLERYKGDERIGFIGGCNYQDSQMRGEGSYYFSMGHHGTWGWASWRRVWKNFDYTLDSISGKEFSSIIRYYGREPRFVAYWEDIFARTKKDRMNDSAWDYQFLFSCWKNHQLAIMPNVNLVSNIGDGDDATHTSNSSPMLHRKTDAILPLIHVTIVVQNKDADFYFHKYKIQPLDYGWYVVKRFPYRLNKWLKRLFGHEGSWIKKLKDYRY